MRDRCRRHAACALGIVDHGARLNVALRRLKRFNARPLLGALFLAFGEYGVPCMLKLDNHPVGKSCDIMHHEALLRATQRMP